MRKMLSVLLVSLLLSTAIFVMPVLVSATKQDLKPVSVGNEEMTTMVAYPDYTNPPSHTNPPSYTHPDQYIAPTYPAPTNNYVRNPNETKIFFDAASAGWANYKKINFYLYRKYDINGFFMWGTRSGDMRNEGNGIWSAYIDSYDIGVDCLCVFSADWGNQQTCELVITPDNYGDTAYCTGDMVENYSASNKLSNVVRWGSGISGNPKCITSVGNIIGDTYWSEGKDDSDIFYRFITEEHGSITVSNVANISGNSVQRTIDDVAWRLGLNKATVTELMRRAEAIGFRWDWDADKSNLEDGYSEIESTRVYLDPVSQISIKSYDKDLTLNVFEDNRADLMFDYLTHRVVLINAYNISLLKDGVEIQPDGTVTVQIPSTNPIAKVFRVEEDGSLTDMNAVFKDGFLVFTTDHFSLYVVGEEVKIGDINNDGTVNGADAGVLSRYTSGWKGYEDKIKNMAAADINGDGNVNGADAGILSRYVSGWNQYARFFQS